MSKTSQDLIGSCNEFLLDMVSLRRELDKQIDLISEYTNTLFVHDIVSKLTKEQKNDYEELLDKMYHIAYEIILEYIGSLKYSMEKSDDILDQIK